MGTETTRKVLAVVGQFNDEGGRPSKVAAMLCEGYATKIVNGGYFTELETLLDEVKDYDVILWFADVPNDKEKIITRVKVLAPKAILVTSKRNDNEKYGIQDLIQRCLKNHSHLLVQFRKNEDVGIYLAKVIDALGNQFDYETHDMKRVQKTIRERIDQIQTFTRVGSVQVGDALDIPLDEDFLEVIHQHSLQFHQKIYGDVPIDRFLGNAAFRCPKGFPSFKGENDLIYVTRRNVDKSMLNKEGFVAVNANSAQVNIPPYLKTEQNTKVEYYGDFKPSVDTPIQLALYRFYNRARYMIHSHVYVDHERCGLPYEGEKRMIWADFVKYPLDDPRNPHSKEFRFADMVIPCGAIEELYKVFRAFPHPDDCNFAVNLHGHGFIVVAEDLDFLRQIIYKPRGFPETQILPYG